jgi:hypothetical protein
MPRAMYLRTVLRSLSKLVLRKAETGAGVVNCLTSDGQWDGLYPRSVHP